MNKLFLGRGFWQIVCVGIAIFGYAVTRAPQFGGALIGITVSETLQLNALETFKFHAAEVLLAWSLISMRLLWACLLAFLVGMFITQRYGIKPAFPSQAERFRNIGKWGLIVVFIIGIIVSLWPAFSTLGFLAHTILITLWFFEQWIILFAVILVPICAGIGIAIAFIAGLLFPTPVGVRWAASSPSDEVGKIAFKTADALIQFFMANAMGLDGTLGSIGVVLRALKGDERT